MTKGSHIPAISCAAEARNLEDAVVGVGHLLWNLARTLKPQDRVNLCGRLML